MKLRAIRVEHALRAIGLLALLGLGASMASAQFGLGKPALDPLLQTWIPATIVVGSGLACLARGIHFRAERAAWLLLGGGIISNTIAQVYSLIAFGTYTNAPEVSLADVFYLLCYPAVYAGLVLMVRARVHQLSSSAWLDGAISALTVASIGSATTLEAIISATPKSGFLGAAVNLAYPLGDLLLVAMVVLVFGLSGWRPGRVWLLLGIGLALNGIADTVYLYEIAKGTYTAGTLLDTLWPAAALAIGFAAWQQTRGVAASIQISGLRVLLVPLIMSVAALGVVAYGAFAHLTPIAIALAVAALALVIVRAGLSLRENIGLLEQSQLDALTDELTGLGNRRRLMEDLLTLLEQAGSDSPGTVALFDLNGFKAYNDRFGHLAGDTILRHLGEQLSESVKPQGTAYRLGGDEFCILFPFAGSDADELLDRAAKALEASGEGFKLSASFGSVQLPVEAQSIAAALSLADRRMYALKDRNRTSAGRQSHDVLMGMVRERQSDLYAHLNTVGQLAWRIGSDMELDAEDLDVLTRAAHLHDLGKTAIPDAVLAKPGPLDPGEWALVSHHTTIGERILGEAPALAPVASLVRSLGEHWNGSGYPDGRIGTAIPLGSRILAVCDAFDEMVSNRPYAKSMSRDEALAELESCAGTQFDPAIVDAFRRSWTDADLDRLYATKATELTAVRR